MQVVGIQYENFIKMWINVPWVLWVNGNLGGGGGGGGRRKLTLNPARGF